MVSPPPLRHREPIVVTGGVHGNEPSGAAALAPLAAAGFTTFGPCNPWGLAHDRRGLADGRDLNRLFGDARCAEAERVRAFLRDHPPGLLFDLHEHRGGGGVGARPYVIQFGPADAFGARLVARLRARYAFAPRPSYGPLVVGRDGLLRPSALALRVAALARRFSLGHWTHHTFGCTAFVVEAPHAWPMAERIAFHVAVLEAARALWTER